MHIQATFKVTDMHLDAAFSETSQALGADFGNVLIVERTDIPQCYGLITYDQNRTITVS